MWRRIIFAIFIFLAASSFISSARASSDDEDVEKKIKELRSQISDYQDQIDEKSDQEKNLQNDISILETGIQKMELQVRETQLVIQDLDAQISAKGKEIDSMQKEVDAKKKTLSIFLQDLYERGEDSPIEIALGSESFSDYFFQADSLESFQERAREIFDQFVALQEKLEEEKKDLLSKKWEQLDLKHIQTDQERTLASQKSVKDSLLGKTQDQKEALLAEVGDLQAQLSALQSLGDPISLDEAMDAARYASKLTDVAPEFLLGVLKVESGLGTNVGGGTYKKDMNPDLWSTFKKICKDLGIDAEKAPVSKRVCYNTDAKDGCGGWGGAMGPAQMMPSTWLGYKSQVEKLMGNKPANPWDIEDSLAAMGLKLAAVDGVTDGKRKAWAKAAGMYLAGSAWESYSWYSDRVLYYADGYKKLLK